MMNLFRRVYSRLQSKNYNKDRAILFKLATSFILPSVFLILIISLLMSFMYNQKMKEDTSDISYLSLSSFSTSISKFLDNTKMTTYEIYNNTNISQLFYDSQVTNELKLKAVSYLKNIFSANHQVYSVYILSNRKIVLSVGGAAYYEENIDELIALIHANPSMLMPIPRQIERKIGSINLITSLYSSASNKSDYSSYVIVNYLPVNINSLDRKFLSNEQTLMATNEFGNIIMNTQSGAFSKNVVNEPFYQIARNSGARYGSTETYIDGVYSIVNYIKGNNDAFTVFFASPYKQFYEKTLTLRNHIVLLCILVLLVLGGIALYFSYKIYSPISYVFFNIKKLIGNSQSSQKLSLEVDVIEKSFSQIINRLNKIEEDDEDTLSSKKSSFINKLLNSQVILSQKDYEYGLKLFNMDKGMDSIYKLLVFRIDGYREFISQNTEESVVFQLNTVESLLEEALSTRFGCSLFKKDTEHFIALLSSKASDNKEAFRDLTEAVNEIKEYLLKVLKLSFTVSPSHEFAELTMENIRSYYDYAYNLTNYRLFYGGGQIFSKETTTVKNDTALKVANLLDSIVDAIRMNALDKYKEDLFSLFSYIEKYSYEDAVSILTKLVMKINSTSEDLQLTDSKVLIYKVDEIYKKVKSFEAYTDLEAWFLDMFNEITNYISVHRQRQNINLCETAIKYIEKNYSNSCISAVLMADMLSITPQHFSRVFHKFTGMSFPDYINNLRLEKAKEMIELTGTTNIKDVAEAVGFNNASYFTSMFRKKYGVPPSKYNVLKNQ